MAAFVFTIVWMLKRKSKRVVMTFFAFFFPLALIFAPVSSDLNRLSNYSVIKNFDVAGMLDNFYFTREILFYLPFSFFTSNFGSVLGTSLLCGFIFSVMVWSLNVDTKRCSLIVLSYCCSGFFFLGIGNITRQTLAAYVSVIILHILNKRLCYVGLIVPALFHNVGIVSFLSLFRHKVYAFAAVFAVAIVVNFDIFSKSVGGRQTGLNLVYVYMLISISLFIYFQWFNKIKQLSFLCFFLTLLQVVLLNTGFVIERISIFILTVVLFLLVGQEKKVSILASFIISFALFLSAYNPSVFKLLGISFD